jgi:hypothetical protein
MRSILSLVIALTFATPLIAQTVTVAPSDNGLRVEIDGQLFTEYLTKGTDHACFYPLIGPGGVPLTREFPPKPGVKVDHPHHSSLWIGHDGVNGINFWGINAESGRVENTGFTDLKSDGPSASFTAKSKWVKPGGEIVLTDERRCVLTALPNGSRQLDISVKLIASTGEVTFRDTKEGTFALRVAPWLAVTGNKFDPVGGKGHILTSAGHKDTAAWGTRATWVSYYGPDPQGGTACITMMDHPSNLRHPTWWHVRDYGLFAANPFGISDFEASPDSPIKKGTGIGGQGTKGNLVLAAGQSFTQRYLILLERTAPEAARLDAAFAAFAKTK